MVPTISDYALAVSDRSADAFGSVLGSGRGSGRDVFADRNLQAASNARAEVDVTKLEDVLAYLYLLGENAEQDELGSQLLSTLPWRILENTDIRWTWRADTLFGDIGLQSLTGDSRVAWRTAYRKALLPAILPVWTNSLEDYHEQADRQVLIAQANERARVGAEAGHRTLVVCYQILGYDNYHIFLKLLGQYRRLFRLRLRRLTVEDWEVIWLHVLGVADDGTLLSNDPGEMRTRFAIGIIKQVAPKCDEEELRAAVKSLFSSAHLRQRSRFTLSTRNLSRLTNLSKQLRRENPRRENPHWTRARRRWKSNASR